MSIVRLLFTGLRRPDRVIRKEDGTPYLLRWHLIPRNRFLNAYLHCFVGNDDPTPHDHPWRSLSVLLKGELIERRPSGKPFAADWRALGFTTESETAVTRFMPFYRSAQYVHRLELPEQAEHVLHLPRYVEHVNPYGLYLRTARDNGDVVPLRFRGGYGLIASNAAWTLFCTGRVRRSWGFWCGSRFVGWREFTGDDGGPRRGCGEE